MSQTPTQFSYAADEIDLFDLVKVVWRARRLIVGLTLAAMLVASALTMTRERTYESRAVFVVQGQQLSVGLNQGPVHNTATLATILRSRVLAETVVDNLQLTEQWGGLTRSAAIKRLQDGVSVNANERDGIVTVTFVDTNPELARDVVAAYVTHFEDLATELNISEADRVVEFAQQRLASVETQLRSAETALRDFKEQYGIVDFAQQTATLVEAHAALNEQIRLLTVELTGKRAYLADNHPEIQDLVSRIAELERQREIIELGDAQDTLDVTFGLSQVPTLSIELERLEREVRVQRDMYELLRQEYESARLEASRKLNIARLIDPPQVPDQPMSRGVVLTVALAGFAGAFGAIMLAFVFEFFRQRAKDERAVEELPFLNWFREDNRPSET